MAADALNSQCEAGDLKANGTGERTKLGIGTVTLQPAQYLYGPTVVIAV